MMSIIEHISLVKFGKLPHWQRYLFDSALAATGVLCVTGIIFIFHLYPRIHNISIVYLIVILWLASTRGRYAAILASLIAFLSFDFFIVPPIYTLTMYQPDEWIALFVFLVNAILTSQLAVALRERAEQAARRERETRILYELVRETNREEEPACQLRAIAQAIVNVFSSWGVLDCAILQPDTRGALCVQTSAYQPAEKIVLSADERATAAWVMNHGRAMNIYDDATFAPSTPFHLLRRISLWSTTKGHAIRESLRLVPLKVGSQVMGVLRLRVASDELRVAQHGHLGVELDQVDEGTTFFSTFLNQVASLIERVRLRQENLRIDILQRTDVLRAALLSSVSHDLRTPLTIIKAAASSLLQEDVSWDDETRRGFASSIEREADRLNHLVGNLLDMSRIEGGGLKLEMEWYSPTALLHDVLDRLQPVLQGRPLTRNITHDLPPVELDYLLMDQVLTNLLENAARYTPRGSPIEVSATYKDAHVIISIADRGPGVPVADLERIFDKFYRVLGDHQRSEETPAGSGLGLAVCRGFVEAHGGCIWAETRADGGAVFFVTLPVGVFERCVP